MHLRLVSNNNFSPAPPYTSQVVTFIMNNFTNGEIFKYFCFIIKGCTTLQKLVEYKSKFIPPTPIETQLLNLLDTFYNSATNLDNERGNLLEYILHELLSTNKYPSHTIRQQAILELFNLQGNRIFSIDPHNIDFFLEEVSANDTRCFECKLSVEQNHAQISCFNNFAQHLRVNNVNCSVYVVHTTMHEAYITLYKKWYPELLFVSPEDLVKGNY